MQEVFQVNAGSVHASGWSGAPAWRRNMLAAPLYHRRSLISKASGTTCQRPDSSNVKKKNVLTPPTA
jgi:hypothetical protein